MSVFIRICFILCYFICMQATGLPWGGDHGPVGQTSFRADMSEPLKALIERPERVHGYFVNSADVFFYAGSTTALNQFLEECASLEKTRLSVLVNQSLIHVSSPWDKSPRETKVNWKMYCAPYGLRARNDALKTVGRDGNERSHWKERLKEVTDGPAIVRLQIRVGDSIQLNRLEVPARIPLAVDGESPDVTQSVQQFVNDHERRRKQHSCPEASGSTDEG